MENYQEGHSGSVLVRFAVPVSGWGNCDFMHPLEYSSRFEKVSIGSIIGGKTAASWKKVLGKSSSYGTLVVSVASLVDKDGKEIEILARTQEERPSFLGWCNIWTKHMAIDYIKKSFSSFIRQGVWARYFTYEKGKDKHHDYDDTPADGGGVSRSGRQRKKTNFYRDQGGSK